MAQHSRFFAIQRSNKRNGKYAKMMLVFDFESQFVRIWQASTEPAKYAFSSLTSLADARAAETEYIMSFKPGQRAYLVTFGSKTDKETLVAASPEEANCIRGMLAYARATCTRDDADDDAGEAAAAADGDDAEGAAGAGGAGAGAGAASGDATTEREVMASSDLGPGLAIKDSQTFDKPGNPAAVFCEKLDMKGSLMFSTYMCLVVRLQSLRLSPIPTKHRSDFVAVHCSGR